METPTFKVAKRLGNCAAQALAGTEGGPPKRLCLVVPGAIADDQCECGQLAVTVPRLFPSVNFPAEAVASAYQSECGAPYRGVNYTISIMRCVPGPNNAGGPPSCAQLETAARIWHEDAQVIQRAVACCLRELEDDGEIEAFVVGATDAAGPRGSCVGSTLQVTVGFPYCLCPPGP